MAVGAGSVLFHATLWRIGQVLDELPMVWGNSAFIYACVTMNDKPGVKRDGAAVATMLITAAITVFYFKNPDAHAPFLVAYGLGVLALVVLSFRMKSLPKECPPLMEISLCSYFFGLLLWVCERTFCSVVQPFQLHAMWHLFAGFGTYSETQRSCAIRWLELRNRVSVCTCYLTFRIAACLYVFMCLDMRSAKPLLDYPAVVLFAAQACGERAVGGQVHHGHSERNAASAIQSRLRT